MNTEQCQESGRVIACTALLKRWQTVCKHCTCSSRYAQESRMNLFSIQQIMREACEISLLEVSLQCSFSRCLFQTCFARKVSYPQRSNFFNHRVTQRKSIPKPVRRNYCQEIVVFQRKISFQRVFLDKPFRSIRQKFVQQTPLAATSAIH